MSAEHAKTMKRQSTTGLAQISSEVSEFHPVLLRVLASLPDVVAVEYTHGVNEMGADFIVTIKEHTLGEIEYVAVVAKLGDMNQQNFENVARQVGECFIPKLVAGGKQQVQVDAVWIATTGAITHNAKLKFNSRFRDKNVKLLTGQKLNQLIERFCPQVWIAIALEAHGQLVELLHAVRRSSQGLIVLMSQIQRLLDADAPNRTDLLHKLVRNAEGCARALSLELHSANYRIRPDIPQERRAVLFFSVMEAALKAIEASAEHRNIQVFIDDSVKGMLPITCDRHFLEVILYNILNNAVRYSYKESTVDVRCVSTNMDHQVSFSNRGLPIRDHEQIFSPGYRSPEAIMIVPHGLGMGLFVARTLANRMGFTLELAAAANTAETTFVLKIPKGVN
jgi:anti-sigma regulatory factor (Ser/Thr protein kinase)